MQITTVSHTRVNLNDLNPDDVKITDIAHALSNICRWGGHTPVYYSVAEHSVILSDFYARRGNPELNLARAALLHDTVEAYTGDFPTPIKNALPTLRKVEDECLKVIFKKYGVDLQFLDQIKPADQAIIKDEADALFGGFDWTKNMRYLNGERRAQMFQFWTPERARHEFLTRFRELFDENLVT